ncbi:MFS transporter [Novosphingobium sp. G106]|nr:MFS transporter [Novosphingobium sp. G106]
MSGKGNSVNDSIPAGIKVPTTAREWKQNWPLVLASSLGFCFFSVMLSTTGLFMEPVSSEFGWGRTLFASGVSIATFTTAIASPFLGIIVDKHGARRLALPGVILTILSMTLFGLLQGQVWLWVVLWLFFGISSACIKSTVWTVAVLGVFEKSKGLALAMVMSGTALSQVIVPPLGNWLIAEHGWRAAYVWLGLGWGLPTLLMTFFFFFDLHDVARKRMKNDKTTQVEAALNLPGLTVKEASRDSAIWRIGISSFVVMVLTQGLMAHLIPILTDAGVTRTHAAWLSSLSGVAGIIGKLITGVLLDRYRPNWIGGVTLGAAALTFLLLMDGLRSPTAIVIALLVNGYAAGTKTQITGYLTASYGGMKSFGVVYGVMAACMAAAAGLGPLVGGVIFDTFGSYSMFLLAGAIGCAFGGLMMISLPGYPKWEKNEPEAEAFA